MRRSYRGRRPAARIAAGAAAVGAVACLLAAAPSLRQVGLGGGHDMSAPSVSASGTPLDGVRIDQKLDAQVPPDLAFRDEDGRTVRLGDYFGSKPMILSLVYYKCPGLCSISLNATEEALKEIGSLSMGRDYDVITVSFDPAEKPELAAAKKRQYLRLYNRPGAEAGWHFLTGDPEPIRRLTDAVGLRYRWDESQQQFLHPGGIMILTPQGKVSQYIVGVDYPPTAVRSSLIAAMTNEIGQIDPNNRVLYCFLRDPHTGKIVLATGRALRVGAVLTMVGLGSLLLFMIRRHPTRPVPVGAGGAGAEGDADSGPTGGFPVSPLAASQAGGARSTENPGGGRGGLS